MHTENGVWNLDISLTSVISIAKTAIGVFTNAGDMVIAVLETIGNEMQQNTQPLTLDNSTKIEYAQTSQWVERISLPAYPANTRGSGKSTWAKLSKNYAFVKHMMNDLGVDNKDYAILRDFNDIRFDTIEIAFNERSRLSASLAVLIWPKYENAKLESNL